MHDSEVLLLIFRLSSEYYCEEKLEAGHFQDSNG